MAGQPVTYLEDCPDDKVATTDRYAHCKGNQGLASWGASGVPCAKIRKKLSGNGTLDALVTDTAANAHLHRSEKPSGWIKSKLLALPIIVPYIECLCGEVVGVLEVKTFMRKYDDVGRPLRAWC